MKSTLTRLFTIIFLFLSFLGITQTSLEGKMTNAETGESIIFGTVALYKSEVLLAGTETDLDGNYFFSDIKPGTYDVEGSNIGFSTKRENSVIIKFGHTNRLDLAISENKIENAVHIEKYNIPVIVKPMSTISKSNTSLPVTNVSAIASSITGISSTNHSVASGTSDVTYIENILPSSGQITAGEWNDLHNWKDWMTLMQDEEYSIMTDRFEIYPTQRYSVLVINEMKAVIPNVPIKLIDNKGKIIWEAITDNAGKAELWAQPYINTGDDESYNITVDGKKVNNPKTIDQGSNTVILQQDCYSTTKMDIVFTVDATSSMSDEIHFLKSELLDVINRIQESNEDVEYRTGSVFYRDTRDDYITRVSPLSGDKTEIIDFVTDQNASGGGDKPEAVEIALEETLNLDWDEDALKLVFLILDAPPHEDEATMRKIRSQIKEAASKGIKLIPITASGIGRETEFLMKFMAMMTNGTYVFITDDSGIGDAHLAPVVTNYEVEKLNDCIVRLISEYSKSYSCDNDYFSKENIEINIYPNPSTQFINIETQTVATKINILSSNGMVVKTIKPSAKSTRIELDDLVNGVYTAVIYIGETTISKQIILLK